jgi:ubiquinol-cytochrome c reductase cytochrome c1 subunit
MRRTLIATAALAVTLLTQNARAEDTLSPPHWQSEGTFGSYDKAALQRGFLVYQTVCASCHAAGELHYRDLSALGFDTAQVAAIASNVKLADGPATPDDRFKNPYPDPAAAAAAFGGAIPPDLSTIVSARPHGTRYVYDLLTGYAAPPPDVTLLPSHYYNAAFPGMQIAMPPPLKDNQVTYADGTAATAAQEASDVAAFLTWAADPNLDSRKEIGLRATLFLIFLTVLAIATKRRIWRESV